MRSSARFMSCLALGLAVLLPACGEDNPVDHGSPPTPPENFVLIQAGSFIMGAPETEPGTEADERPQHEVVLTHDFFMHDSEVSNAQFVELVQWAYDNGYVTSTTDSLFDALDGSQLVLQNLITPDCEVSFSSGVFSCENPEHPVKKVNFYGAASFCDWLSLSENLPRAYDHATWQCNGDDPYNAEGYRLPTEAEWEYACRAGSTTEFANGPLTVLGCEALDPVLDLIGWYCGNSDLWSEPIKTKVPNAWGLYDMHGSVWEWCNDRHGPYPSETVTDPVGPSTGSLRVRRGGTWYFDSAMARSANRHVAPPEAKDLRDEAFHSIIGIRPVRTVP